MFARLRFRLLASYLLLMVVMIGTITIAAFLTTSARAAPPDQTFTTLTALARGLDLQSLVLEFAPLREGGLQGSRPQQGRNENDGGPAANLRELGEIRTEIQVEYTELLQEFSATRDVRVLWFTANNRDEVVVRYDSDGVFAVDDPMPAHGLRVETGSPAGQDNYIRLPNGSQQVYGAFSSEGDEWLFSGVATQTRLPTTTSVIVVASIRPTQTLQDILADFGGDLLLPLAQAAAISLVIAVLLAAVISRTIARPLQAVARAAQAVAQGDLDQQVPVSGPHEVRSVAESFNEMSAEVRAAQQSQQDFLANVSHDLKTPLTSIQGYSQAIMDGTAKQPDQAAAIIYDEASRLTRMVNELTDLARMEAGQFSLHITSLDVSQIVDVVARKLQPLADKKEQQLTVQTPMLQPIAGDGDRLVQVFNNLIGNAIKYTPRGGRIAVEARANSEGVDILVTDNGAGIPPEDLPRVFERFYQVDKSRGPKRGTGLGLAITYEIVQLHGGKLNVQSVEGQGTRFAVWLPYDHKAETLIMRRRENGKA